MRPLPQAEDIQVEATHHEPNFCYDPIEIDRSTTLCGYYQSEKYFKNCEEELRGYLTPGERLAEEIRECREKTFRSLNPEKTCSVCVRRGDYVWKSGFFLELAATTYYDNALRRFSYDTEFVVFSDDIEWCRVWFMHERFQGHRFTFAYPPHEMAGLFLMASCKDHIIANSTYPWWGAWLNPRPEKRVIAPGSWFTGTGLDKRRSYREGGFHDTKDLIPENWEKIPIYHREF